MVLTKLKGYISGTYEYVNLDGVDFISVESDHYDLHMADGASLCIDISDTTITNLVLAADAAYTS